MADLWLPPSAGRPSSPQSALSNLTRRASTERQQAEAALDAAGAAPQDPMVAEMRKNRQVNMRRGASSFRSGSGAEMSFATMRPRDPMFYWKQNNLPWEYDKPEELIKIRAYCRVLYATHPVIASAIDIYSKYPLTGMELTCKDEALTEFYTTLFFDQLDYEEYLPDVGREYWLVGEAFPLGSFNETLGVWEDDELINPDDVDVIRSPFLKDPRFQMKLPEVLRKIIQDRSPKWEFEALMRSYPELKNFIGEEARMPVSNILLKQLKFKVDTFHPRGLPILLRAFRAIMQEEMLNSAQDAIADRLYTPLVLAKLGASATDLGTQNPWIPTDEDLDSFEEALDAALAADFRVLTHHFAIDMQTVFGRENMPNMDADFERLTERTLQAFGLSKTMLSGAQGGETYAADALNRDLISQLLTQYQRKVLKFYKDRALVVAEAQEHFDYEERGGKRYPVMEEVLEVDEETGEQRIVEQPKLLIPDIKFKAMNMRNETDLRQFYEALRAQGVPISMETRMVNVPVKLKDEIEKVRKEQVDQAVEAQQTRKDTYLALRDANLPVPDDLKADFEPKARDIKAADEQREEAPVPTIGVNEAADTMGLAPTPGDYAKSEPGDEGVAEGQVIQLPVNKALGEGSNRVPESDEMRAGMPRASTRSAESIAAEAGLMVNHNGKLLDDDGRVINEGRGRLISGPKHVGMRRRLPEDVQQPEWLRPEDEEAADG